MAEPNEAKNDIMDEPDVPKNDIMDEPDATKNDINKFAQAVQVFAYEATMLLGVLAALGLLQRITRGREVSKEIFDICREVSINLNQNKITVEEACQSMRARGVSDEIINATIQAADILHPSGFKYGAKGTRFVTEPEHPVWSKEWWYSPRRRTRSGWKITNNLGEEEWVDYSTSRVGDRYNALSSDTVKNEMAPENSTAEAFEPAYGEEWSSPRFLGDRSELQYVQVESPSAPVTTSDGLRFYQLPIVQILAVLLAGGLYWFVQRTKPPALIQQKIGDQNEEDLVFSWKKFHDFFRVLPWVDEYDQQTRKDLYQLLLDFNSGKLKRKQVTFVLTKHFNLKKAEVDQLLKINTNKDQIFNFD